MMKTHTRKVSLIIILLLMVHVTISFETNRAEAAVKNGDYLTTIAWNDLDTNKQPTKNETSNGDSLTLTNNRGESVEYENGLNIHANTDVSYNLSELNYNYLTTWVGVDRSNADDTQLKFEIYTDDSLAYESKWMDKNSPMEYVTVDFSNSDTLTVSVKQKEGGVNTTSGNLAAAQLHTNNPITVNDTDVKQYDGKELVFSDEFDGDSLSREYWDYETTPENGSHHYKNKVGKDENVWVEDGNLKIQAKPLEGSEKFKTTSGSITSQNKVDFQYGRIDVRAKIPTETGMWPAIWMMPTNQEYGWPMEGEIDIMELISQNPDKIWSTVHSGIDGNPEYYYNKGGTYTIDEGTFFDDYHVYSMDWEPDVMRFYVDDILIEEIKDWKNWIIDKETGEIVERDHPAPFNQDYFIKMNLATGGNWAIDVDETTRFGERTTMNVDYVRVYQDVVQDYTYSTSNPYENGEQGPVWYAQKGKDSKWENYESFDNGLARWATTMGNDSSFVSLNSIHSYFNESSNYNAASVAFRSPHKGYVKSGLNNDVKIDGKGQESEVEFQISEGTMTVANDIIYSGVLTNESEDVNKRVYTKVAPDDMIRFEILKTREVVENFDPIVEYIDESEFVAFNELNESILALQDTDTSEYSEASVEDFEEALKKAKVLLNGSGDEVKYNEANETLQSAYNNLSVELESDFPILEALIEEAKRIEVDNKTDESVTSLYSVIDESEELIASKNATQDEVDEQIERLRKAIENLVVKDEPVKEVDTSKLKNEVKKAKEVNQETKTKDSLKKFINALEEAESILKNTKASQKQVDNATKNLEEAIQGLQEKDTNESTNNDTTNSGSNINGSNSDDTSSGHATGQNGQNNKLPNTATNMFNWLIAGVMLFVVGMVVVVTQRKRA